MTVLEGKAAIVTGSARGIGRATAELLCAHGARVLVNDLDADLAAEAAAEIEGDTAVFAGDLTQEGVCEALVEKAVAEFGQLDIVVNNAGYTWDGIAHKMSRRAIPRDARDPHRRPLPRAARCGPVPARAREEGAARRGARCSARS